MSGAACACSTPTRRADAARFRAVARSSRVDLVYYRDGREIVERAARHDLGELPVGTRIERDHGGPRVGSISHVERTPDELIVTMDITDPATAREIATGTISQLSCEYDVTHVDAQNYQRGVRVKAVALISVGRGRCGETCSIVGRADAPVFLPAAPAPRPRSVFEPRDVFLRPLRST